MITDKDLEDLRDLANIRAYGMALVIVSRVFAGVYKTKDEATAELRRVFNQDKR